MINDGDGGTMIVRRTRVPSRICRFECQHIRMRTTCHLLGQPATVLLANLDMLGKALGDSASPATREMLSDAMQAADHLRDMLQKLNATVVYRPTPYANNVIATDGPEDRHDDSHIIEV